MKMARKKKVILPDLIRKEEHIKVRLDARTVITLSSLKSFDFWKQRYPQAAVLGT
jgi:hypothetical protein